MAARPLSVYARTVGKVYAEHYGIAGIVAASFVAGVLSAGRIL